MSTIKADLIQNAAGTKNPAVTKAEFVHARCNWNQTGTQAIRQSFAVSSIVDLGVGQTTVNLTNAYTTANDHSPIAGTYPDNFETTAKAYPQTVTSVTVWASSGAGAYADGQHLQLHSMGVLA